MKRVKRLFACLLALTMMLGLSATAFATETAEKVQTPANGGTVTFEKGVPTSVNGKQMKVSDIIRELNRLGGKHLSLILQKQE